MDTKHTPGPWFGGECPSLVAHFGATNAFEVGPVGFTVAVVAQHEDPETQQANARLIASAPELLEALQECITDDGAQCIVTCDVAYMIRRFKAINKIVRAAIDKAR